MRLIAGQSMSNPALSKYTAISVSNGRDPTKDEIEFSEVVGSHLIALEAGTMSHRDVVSSLFPDIAKFLIDGNNDHIICWVCQGTGTKVAWPTQFKPKKRDVQPVGVYKQLLAKDPENLTPYAVCIEKPGDEISVWYESGKMGWWGLDKPHQSKDGWRSDVQDLFKNIPDDRCVVVVDCHI
jgi:hypothetical protein